jgi:putative endonuclease
MERAFYVYMMTNRPYGTLYIGITNDLVRRAWEHREGFVDAFTKRHALHRLVWFETHSTAYEAITREKLIKKWHRDWKINLVQSMNPRWDDLFAQVAV